MKTFELIRDGEPVGIEARAPDYVCAQEYFKDKQWPIGFHYGRYFEVKEKLAVREAACGN